MSCAWVLHRHSPFTFRYSPKHFKSEYVKAQFGDKWRHTHVKSCDFLFPKVVLRTFPKPFWTEPFLNFSLLSSISPEKICYLRSFFDQPKKNWEETRISPPSYSTMWNLVDDSRNCSTFFTPKDGKLGVQKKRENFYQIWKVFEKKIFLYHSDRIISLYHNDTFDTAKPLVKNPSSVMCNFVTNCWYFFGTNKFIKFLPFKRKEY